MVRVGIIGLRHGHILSIVRDAQSLEEAEVVAVAEEEESILQPVRELGLPIYADHKEMLDREELDAVAVATVNSEKGAVIAECLTGGLHVIADKPLVTSMEDLDAVRNAWEKSAKKLLVMLTLRYNAPFLALRRFVDEGGLGEPVAFFATGPHKLSLPSRKPWMLRDDQCGGIIVDLGCHYVDAVRWYSGLQCRGLAAVHGNKRFTQLAGFTDFAQVQMRLAGGAVATVQVDWLTPDAAPYHGDMRFIMTGTKGTAEIRQWPEPQVMVATVECEPFTLPLPEETLSVGQDFLQAIEENRATALSTEDCLEASRLTLLARQAAVSGEIVAA